MLQKSARNLKDMIANPNAMCPNFFVGRRNPKSELPLSENDVILSLKTVSDSYAYFNGGAWCHCMYGSYKL